MRKALFFLLLTASCTATQAQEAWDAPSMGNPFIPGYFADPTIRKFGDTYYIYATTDGTGNGYGPAQVWMSKDFRHWRNTVMNWPTTEVVWAPDVIQTREGKFHYYYCQPCMVHVGESDTPVGPWRNMLGRDDAVLMPDRYCDPMAITLDPMVFTDEDGSRYLFVGTWGIYDKSGCGWARLAEDGKSFSEKGLVPNTEIKDFFEAPFVFKRDGKYYFTYSSGSCHDDTYRVQYAVSTEGPTGPYEYKGCILKTNADGTIHGPGHHSILKEGDAYYIVYHRHNNPHSVHGFNRQLCIDRMEFDEKGDIQPVLPTHSGVLPDALCRKKAKRTARNLAFGAQVTASSVLSKDFRAEYAVDDNNGTLWRPANNQGTAWLQLDLGKVLHFNQVWLQFEYPTFFYQYKVETSVDGHEWQIFADRTDNRKAGSPMIEKAEAKARYLRITITDTQKNGHFGALWNVMVYDATKKNNPEALLPEVEGMDMTAVEKGYPNLYRKDVETEERKAYPDGLVCSIDATDPATLQPFEGGEELIREVVQGKWGLYFDGTTVLRSRYDCPKNFTYNAAFTLSAWVLNPTAGPVECIASITPQTGDLTALQFQNGRDRTTGLMNHAGSFESIGCPDEVARGEGKWQHWTVTYDGWHERVYLNGQLLHEKNNFLMLRPSGPITLGAGPRHENPFTGYIHSLKLYDRGLSDKEVKAEFARPSDTTERATLDLDALRLKSESIGPGLVRLTLTDAKGIPVRTGRLNFLSGIFTQTEGQPLSVTVQDDEGHSRLMTYEPVEKKLLDGYSIVQKTESIRLESQDCNLDRDPSHNGPMRLEEVEGDFLMQVRISDIMGSSRHSTPGYNEGGLVIVGEEEGGKSQNLVHLGVFPNYNCGNMLTTVSRRGRPQYPNQQGWDYDPWLQLQRKGNLIHARTSKDGVCWKEMPGSPVEASLLGKGRLKAGIYQTTYSANKAWVEFSDFLLYKSQEVTLSPPSGKAIYIPKDLADNDFTCKDARYSYARMACTEDIVVFWEKPFGDDPAQAPDLEGQSMKVDIENLLKRTQGFYDYYKDTLKFILPGSNADKYRMMVMLNYSTEGTAYGGDYDGVIGALWVTPNRLQDPKLNCIAHELGHSFQSQIGCDKQGVAWGGGGIFEMTSQWMLWQVNPQWTTDENYHWQTFIRQHNLPFLAGANIYCSPYVLEYWAMKHGVTVMADLFRAGRRGENPAITYMRLFHLSLEEMNEEMTDCYSRLLTFDFPRVKNSHRGFAGQLTTTMEKGGQREASTLFTPLAAYQPGTWGFNIIDLSSLGVPTATTLGFEGLNHESNATYCTRLVTVKDGVPHYGSIQKGHKAELQLPRADEGKAYLVVVGCPRLTYKAEGRKAPAETTHYPYRLSLR